MSYLIAAYVVVIAALVGYGLRVQAQRRAQQRSLDSRGKSAA